MKALKMFKIAAIGFMVAGLFPANAMAAGSTGTAEALIATPITIEVDPEFGLNFGSIVSGIPGTVTISPVNGQKTSSPGIDTLSSFGNKGLFLVEGDPNRAYNATVDATTSLSNGTDAMNVNLTSDRNSNLGSNGRDFIGVGGTLTLVGTESSGSYTGTYNVSVDY